MDFPVEATICLDRFPDKSKVRSLLRSHGFEVKDLGGGEVRVKGLFLNLRAVKAHLEQMIQTRPSSSSRVPKVFPGAVSTYYSDKGQAMPPPSPPSPSYASGSSHRRPASQDYRVSSPPDLQGSFVVDADVFRYASQLRSKELEDILICHNVEMNTQEDGDNTSITLQGKSSRTAAPKLQSLLEDLNRFLRTQEVPLRDLSPQGQVLLQGIKRNRNVSGSVLVQEMGDRLHLIGPSKDSYELKQSLLGTQVDRPRSRERFLSKSSRGRSSSLPSTNQRRSERDGAGVAPSAGGAAGFQPSKDETQVGGSDPRRRSFSEPEGKNPTKTNHQNFKQKAASFFKTLKFRSVKNKSKQFKTEF